MATHRLFFAHPSHALCSTASELRTLIAWSAFRHNLRFTLTDLAVDIGPFLYGLPSTLTTGELASSQVSPSELFETNLAAMHARRDGHVWRLPAGARQPDDGEVRAAKSAALTRLRERVPTEAENLLCARDALQVLVRDCLARAGEHGASYEELAAAVSPFYQQLVQGGSRAYACFYAFLLRALAAVKSERRDGRWYLTFALPPTEDELRCARLATWDQPMPLPSASARAQAPRGSATGVARMRAQPAARASTQRAPDQAMSPPESGAWLGGGCALMCYRQRGGGGLAPLTASPPERPIEGCEPR